MKFEIRNIEAGDIESVKDIEVHSNLSPWSVDDYLSELKREKSIFKVAVGKEDEPGYMVLGFLIGRVCPEPESGKNQPSRSTSELVSGEAFEILNIGVRERNRNIGIGTALLDSSIKAANDFGVDTIWLEVRKSNESAIGFYKSRGFKPIYERKKLFSLPTETGIVMKMFAY